MQSRLQRLLVFAGLCATFGVAAWMVEVENSNSRALLAALPTTESSKTEDKCVTECTKANDEKFKCGKSVTIDEKGEIESSKPDPAVKAGTCRTTYTDQKGKQHTIDQNTKGEWVGKDGKPIQLASSKQGPLPEYSSTDYPTEPKTVDAAQGRSVLDAAELRAPSTDPSKTSLATNQANPSNPTNPNSEISRIAEGRSQDPFQSATSRPQQTFSPSPQLSGSQFDLGSLFGMNRGREGNGVGVFAQEGGTLAYVPVSRHPILTSPTFDPPTSIAFPKARPSPEEILENLAKNTKRSAGEKGTEGELRGRRVVDNVVSRALDTFFAPAAEFVRAFFAEEGTGEASESDADTRRGENKERKLPLGRGRLVLTLAADDSLVPGDPSQVGIERSNRAYQAFESIPASNRAWVQGTPRAGEGIGEIARAPTYGWGDVQEDVELSAAPDVADIGYEPLGAQGDALSPLDVVDDAGGEPRSFFSVMGKSLGTIAEAVNSLLKRITSALFWWL